jgi:hypothetical protein
VTKPEPVDAQKGTDHAGHIRKVPQEEDSPSMYIAQIMCEYKRGIFNQMSSLLQHYQKINILKAQWLHCNATTSH